MQDDSQLLVDQMLVMQWQDGHSDAMQQLVERWQLRLWRHAHRLTGDADAAWDVLQNAWIGMIRAVGRLDDPARFPYWAYRIVTNKACDWIRRQQRRRHRSLDSESAVADRHPDVSVQVESREEFSKLLASLSIEHRAVVTLRFVEGFSVREVSEILGLPEGTVKSRLHYAKETLRERLA